MPGKVLPTFTPAEVESHNNAKSCYVTLGSKVFDITSFVDDHPGGGDLILEYAGKDVGEIMRDTVSHEHSEAAYEILDDSLVGFIGPASKGESTVTDISTSQNGQPVYATTGMSREEDLSVETDYTKDYQTNKFLDLNKPLLPQLWFGGFSKEFYLQQVHRPRHYKGGESAPLFGNFLEPLSKNSWYMVPIIWLPPVTYGTFLGISGLGSVSGGACYWLFGLFLWSLIEYVMHRFLFHMEKYVFSTSLNLINTNVAQCPSGQSSGYHVALPPPWHSSLPTHGQVPTCDAAFPIRHSSHAVLEVGTFSLLLQLVCCCAGILWRCFRIHLL